MSFIGSILGVLQNAAELGATFADIALSNYPESYRKSWRLAYRSGSGIRFSSDWPTSYEEYRRYKRMLSRLKGDGLIAERPSHGGAFVWQLTKKGAKRVIQIKRRAPPQPPLGKRSYEPPSSRTLTIVAYDVPEREERKRRWLRENLKALGFTLLQRSLWIGATALPAELLKDIKKLGLLSCVHIFSVARSGTVRKVA